MPVEDRPRTLIGPHVSPYVRKVVLALDAKGLGYEIDPITPFTAAPSFKALSPLRRVPVLIDGDLVINDSTVICEYLDEAYPGTPLYPATPAARARARWIEEWADSLLGHLIVEGLLFERIVAPAVFKRPTDEAVVARALAGLPAAIDWLETQAPADGFLFGDAPMVADWTLASLFRNAELAHWTPDRWPTVAAWIARVQALPAFQHTVVIEQIMMTAPRGTARDAMVAAGVRLAPQSYAGREPSASVMGFA